jgi:hypothetical protein
METPSQYKITREGLTDAKLLFLLAVNNFLTFFGLRKSQLFWGVVYDSVTKQPLDPVIVKLLYADGGEVESGVTDLHGRYGFLARPGKFKIFARRTNYTFPSTRVTGEKDGVYENLYHGEFFTLLETSEVVAPNIPMDPQSPDWNQQAKTKMQIGTHPYAELLVKSLAAVLFWFSFVFCLIGIGKTIPVVPFWLWVVLGFYLLVFFLKMAVPEPRLCGQIALGQGITEPMDLYLELGNKNLPGILLGRAIIHKNGRFLLRASPGNYILSVYSTDEKGQKSFLSALPVRVGSVGVFNSTLVIERTS